MNLLAKDIYVSTIAGAKAKEPSCDLAIVASLASAAKNKPVLPFTCAIGEISLTGQVRSASRMETRLKEAARIGYKRAIVCHLQKKIHVAGIDVVEVNNLKEALKALGL